MNYLSRLAICYQNYVHTPDKTQNSYNQWFNPKSKPNPYKNLFTLVLPKTRSGLRYPKHHKPRSSIGDKCSKINLRLRGFWETQPDDLCASRTITNIYKCMTIIPSTHKHPIYTDTHK